MAEGTFYDYVEVRTFSGINCGGPLLNGMISGTRQRACQRVAGGDYQSMVCPNTVGTGTAADTQTLTINTYARSNNVPLNSSMQCSTAPSSSYSFTTGCIRTSIDTSTKETCVSTNKPFFEYGMGIVTTQSISLAACNGPLMGVDSWTFTPLDTCVSAGDETNPYIINACDSIRGTYNVTFYESSDTTCSGAPSGPMSTLAIDSCRMDQQSSVMFEGMRCVNT